ncbi:MAG: ELWxxDGT repeat protein [Acidobacteriota bacterium]
MKRLAMFLLTLCLAATAAAAQPIRVMDINTVQTGGTWLWPYNAEFTAMNGVSYFAVSDGVHGLELWRSDGTEAGTRLVRDICPGSCSGVPRWLTAVGTTLYFSANDGAHGAELWKSDGTEAGTVLVSDAVPGLQGSLPINLFAYGGALYFSAEEPATGRELWTSDGTAAGTALVKDLRPGPSGSSPRPLSPQGLASFVYLSAEDDDHGRELWKTDGTAAGTVLVKDIYPGTGSSNTGDWAELPGYATAIDYGGLLIFAASDGSSGDELWISNGTDAGTHLLKDINPGSGSSWPATLAGANGVVLFRADDGTHGFELWATDSTAAGTALVKDIQPGATGSTPWEITPMGGQAFFRADDGTHGYELWKTDGTEANTALVADIRTGSASGIPVFGPAGFAVVGSRLVFFADDGVHGLEPWSSDGSTTAILADLNAAGSSMPQLHPINNDRRLVLNGLWYFRAVDSETDVEVYVSDGTPAGTGQLKEINDQTSAFDLSYLGIPFGASTLADRNGTLFFQATDGVAGSELWKSDGYEAGTQQVADIFPGAGGSLPFEITALGDKVVFSAEDSVATGRELWVSDGTPGGTSLLKDLEPTNTTSGGFPWWLTRAGNRVFFNGYDGSAEKLWQTDGTPAGTVVSRTTAPTATSPTELTALGSLLLYSGAGPDGDELWRTDGTPAGTVQVADIAPGTASSWPDRLTLAGSRVFFSAFEPASGRELWVSDGTGPGTHRVKDIVPGAGSGILLTNDDVAFRLEHWAAAGNRVFFPAGLSEGAGATGEELWVSDGTESGTHLVLDILPGARSSEIRGLTAVAGRVFFAADDGVHGRELWTSDGTTSGTRLVVDMAPGAASSLPEQLLAVNQGLVFSAWLPSEGRELMATDHDGLFTQYLTNIAPEGESSSPQELTVSGSRLYFVATDTETGYELYSIPVSAVDGGLDFYSVTSCRLVDTRTDGGALVSGTPRRITAAGPCGVPGDARALAVTVTVVGATGSGNLLLYRGATDPTPTSTINFAAGVHRTNNAIVEIGQGAINARASLGGGGQVDVILDVTGYFK